MTNFNKSKVKLIMKRIVNNIEYELLIKKVKNINLRVKKDKSVIVSANRFISVSKIDDFVLNHANWIRKAQEKNYIDFKDANLEEAYENLFPIYKSAYEKYRDFIPNMPLMKIKKLKSAWGICHYKKGYISLNANLLYLDDFAKRYVIFHELNHFLVHDHSQKFYDKLYEFLPTWKEDKKSLIQKG